MQANDQTGSEQGSDRKPVEAYDLAADMARLDYRYHHPVEFLDEWEHPQWEPYNGDDFEAYNQAEADDYRHENDDEYDSFDDDDCEAF